MTAIYFHLLIATAQGTASCSQIRTSDLPQATDVASLIRSQASSAWSQLQATTSLPLSTFQGYGLATNASSSSLDTGLCQNVLSKIAQSCVLNANYYGGLYFRSAKSSTFQTRSILRIRYFQDLELREGPLQSRVRSALRRRSEKLPANLSQPQGPLAPN